MNWKFWKKEKGQKQEKGMDKDKQSRPKELPAQIGQYLVTELKQNPDWVWSLRCVTRTKNGVKAFSYFRVFSDSWALKKKISIRNYSLLDEHSELILYEGWTNKNTGKLNVRDMRTSDSGPQETIKAAA